MALVCGNCGGDLELGMEEDPKDLKPSFGSTVRCVDCEQYGVLAIDSV